MSDQVRLDRSYFNLASDMSQYVQVGTYGAIGGGGNRIDDIAVEGSYRNYANGNTRLILGTATLRQQTMVVHFFDQDSLKLFMTWMGQTVLFRDTYGRRLWGTYIETQSTDVPLSGLANDDLNTAVAIIFTTVAYDEAV